MWQAPDNLRMVFDTTAPAVHRLFLLSNPDRVVIDLKHAAASHLMLPKDELEGSWLKGIRSAEQPDGDFRVVLDLNRRVTPSSFVLKPNDRYGNRLVVDLKSASVGNAVEAKSQAAKAPVEVKSAKEMNSGRDIIIAIDAGHGGDDPGAIGYRGTREKDVTLQVARRLKSLVDKESGMHAVMIRNGDYYVSLRDRVRKAREAKADLMVSIHADAFKNPHASGSSVFALSSEGATSEAARWLAESENESDLIGGVSLDDKDQVLASVLLDLSQTASIEASLDVGGNVLRNLRKVGHVHKARVEQAGFVVLKSPDIPSILVETAFISNPVEERKLKTYSQQMKIATAVMKGVREYFHDNPPPGTLLAMRNTPKQAHVIKTGETLSSIARHYQVPVKAIRTSNGLDSDQLQVGQVLQIPLVYGG
jgi:N-acetylmuramoyl-L-alanine amidase